MSGDFAKIKPGVAYLALCTGAPVVPVACLGTRRWRGPTACCPPCEPASTSSSVRRVRLEATPWPRRRDVVREKARWLQEWLVGHLREAYVATGRQLPGESVREERVPGPLVAREPSLDVEDVS